MSEKKEYLVFDANFFICMLQIRARNILGNLEKAANKEIEEMQKRASKKIEQTQSLILKRILKKD